MGNGTFRSHALAVLHRSGGERRVPLERLCASLAARLVGQREQLFCGGAQFGCSIVGLRILRVLRLRDQRGRRLRIHQGDPSRERGKSSAAEKTHDSSNPVLELMLLRWSRGPIQMNRRMAGSATTLVSR